MKSQARQLRTRDRKELAAKHPMTGRWLRRATKSITPRLIASGTPERIVAHLNGEESSAAARRLSRFIQLFNRARDLNDSFRLFFDSFEDMNSFLDPCRSLVATYESDPEGFRTGWNFKFEEIQAINNQLNATLTELNRLARRYRWYPFIRHMGFEMSYPFEVTESWEGRGTGQPWDTFAIWWLCSNNGKWIDYFRQCKDCSRWFFALAEHQSYCSDACRKRFASQSDEFKEKRRLYMRTYRQSERERDSAAKAAATKKHALSSTRRG